MNQGNPSMRAGSRLRGALLLAILADLVQILVFPLFVAGGASPADDLLDLSVAGVLTFLLGWHWEFLPSFAAKLIPGVEFVPLWTLAVANVYRKTRAQVSVGAAAQNQPTGSNTPNS